MCVLAGACITTSWPRLRAYHLISRCRSLSWSASPSSKPTPPPTPTQALLARMTLDFSLFFKAGARPSEPLQGHGFLVHGGRQCGKSSFAMQAAVNAALCGRHVLVACPELLFQRKFPIPFIPLGALPDEVLQRIEFLKPTSWRELTIELMKLQAVDVASTLLVVDSDGFTDGPLGLPGPDHTSTRQASASSMASNPTAPMAQTLSFLESLVAWSAQLNPRSPLQYVLVNNQLPDSSGRLPLPFAAFPLVNVFIGSTGTVQVTPMAGDGTVVAPAFLSWDDGLKLM